MSNNCFPCPCCGYRTLGEEPPGTFEICPVCLWEDDDVQFRDPDYPGGANRVSLKDARENLRRFGASTMERKKGVRRRWRESRKSPRAFRVVVPVYGWVPLGPN